MDLIEQFLQLCDAAMRSGILVAGILAEKIRSEIVREVIPKDKTKSLLTSSMMLDEPAISHLSHLLKIKSVNFEYELVSFIESNILDWFNNEVAKKPNILPNTKAIVNLDNEVFYHVLRLVKLKTIVKSESGNYPEALENGDLELIKSLITSGDLDKLLEGIEIDKVGIFLARGNDSLFDKVLFPIYDNSDSVLSINNRLGLTYGYDATDKLDWNAYFVVKIPGKAVFGTLFTPTLLHAKGNFNFIPYKKYKYNSNYGKTLDKTTMDYGCDEAWCTTIKYNKSYSISFLGVLNTSPVIIDNIDGLNKFHDLLKRL